MLVTIPGLRSWTEDLERCDRLIAALNLCKIARSKKRFKTLCHEKIIKINRNNPNHFYCQQFSIRCTGAGCSEGEATA